MNNFYPSHSNSLYCQSQINFFISFQHISATGHASEENLNSQPEIEKNEFPSKFIVNAPITVAVILKPF